MKQIGSECDVKLQFMYGTESDKPACINNSPKIMRIDN